MYKQNYKQTMTTTALLRCTSEESFIQKWFSDNQSAVFFQNRQHDE